MEAFRIEDLTFTYPGTETPVLSHIDLTIRRGEYAVFLGASGSGKTTLLRQLKPTLAPVGKRGGRVFFHGAVLDPADRGRTQAEKIGFVMQQPEEQPVTEKVWHELAFGLENLGTPQETMRLRVGEMASYFGIQDWFERDISVLSGGQKQLLNLASVMAMQPEVLILDEPTSQLDPIAAADFLNTVRKINTELGTTVLITEHRLEDVLPYADRAVALEKGRVLAEGKPEEVGERLFKRGSSLFSAMPVPMRVSCVVTPAAKPPLTVRDGREWLTELFASKAPTVVSKREAPAGEEKEPALEAKHLWFRYERNAADVLKDASLRVSKGEIYALVGGNGTGKSTLLKTICGVCRPYRGSVELFGKPLKAYRAGELFRGNLAMLPQNPRALFGKNSVLEELLEICPKREKCLKMAERFALGELLSSHPMDLSGGEQQRTALAKVMLTDPKLLLLDEPTKGMDCACKTDFGAYLRRIAEEGTAVLMVSHDVEFCAEYAHRVGMFFRGELLTENTPRAFFGQNSFYTTAANRMSRCVFQNAVTAGDVIDLCRENLEE